MAQRNKETVKKHQVWKIGESGLSLMDGHDEEDEEDDGEYQKDLNSIVARDLEPDELHAAITAFKRAW